MIATLDRQWQLQALHSEEIICPWPERDHTFGCIERSLVSFHTPAVARPVQRTRVASKSDTAVRLKTRRVGAGNAEGVAYVCCLRPEHSMREHGIERGLERLVHRRY